MAESDRMGLSDETWAMADRLAEQRQKGVVLSERMTAVPPFGATHQGRVEALLRQQIAATLAAGIMAGSAQPLTADQAVTLFRQVQEALYPPG